MYGNKHKSKNAPSFIVGIKMPKKGDVSYPQGKPVKDEKISKHSETGEIDSEEKGQLENVKGMLGKLRDLIDRKMDKEAKNMIDSYMDKKYGPGNEKSETMSDALDKVLMKKA